MSDKVVHYEVYLSSDDESGENADGYHYEKRCDSLDEAIVELEKNQNKHPDRQYYIDRFVDGSLDEEFKYISKKDIYRDIDDIRRLGDVHSPAFSLERYNNLDLIASYIEANIDSFMDCYNTDVDE